MNCKTFIAGITAGFIGGYILSEKLKQNTPLSGEKVLTDIKKAFKKEGKVDGSWLQTRPEDYQKSAMKTKVYRGGISTQINGERQQFEFIADAYTGSILDIYQL